jgi:hypothetical protein
VCRLRPEDGGPKRFYFVHENLLGSMRHWCTLGFKGVKASRRLDMVGELAAGVQYLHRALPADQLVLLMPLGLRLGHVWLDPHLHVKVAPLVEEVPADALLAETEDLLCTPPEVRLGAPPTDTSDVFVIGCAAWMVANAANVRSLYTPSAGEGGDRFLYRLPPQMYT